MSAPSNARRRARPLAPLLTLLLVAACGGAPERPGAKGELDTVDVAPAIDAAASTEQDSVATPAAAGAGVGVLPGGFPREVPLPRGGSLVDYGDGAAGTWVAFVVAAPPPEVEAAYRASLERAGFRPGASGTWSRGSLTVAVTASARGAGTTLRVEPLAR